MDDDERKALIDKGWELGWTCKPLPPLNPDDLERSRLLRLSWAMAVVTRLKRQAPTDFPTDKWRRP